MSCELLFITNFQDPCQVPLTFAFLAVQCPLCPLVNHHFMPCHCTWCDFTLHHFMQHWIWKFKWMLGDFESPIPGGKTLLRGKVTINARYRLAFVGNYYFSSSDESVLPVASDHSQKANITYHYELSESILFQWKPVNWIAYQNLMNSWLLLYWVHLSLSPLFCGY